MSTFSNTGQTKTPPPLTMRKPTSRILPSGSITRRLRPEMTSNLVGTDLGVATGPDPEEDKQDDTNRGDAADGHGAGRKLSEQGMEVHGG